MGKKKVTYTAPDTFRKEIKALKGELRYWKSELKRISEMMQSQLEAREGVIKRLNESIANKNNALALAEDYIKNACPDGALRLVVSREIQGLRSGSLSWNRGDTLWFRAKDGYDVAPGPCKTTKVGK